MWSDLKYHVVSPCLDIARVIGIICLLDLAALAIHMYERIHVATKPHRSLGSLAAIVTRSSQNERVLIDFLRIRFR